MEVRVTMPLTAMRLSTSLGLRSLITLVSPRLYGLHCTPWLLLVSAAYLAMQGLKEHDGRVQIAETVAAGMPVQCAPVKAAVKLEVRMQWRIW